jgi:hypothetical protein
VGPLNFVGKFETDASGPHSSESLTSHVGEHVDIATHSHHGSFDIVTIPDAHLLFSGHFERHGSDLVVSDRDHHVLVPDYFRGEKRPTLVSSDGAPLDAKVVEALTGHTAYAQAGGAVSTAKVIGHVVKLSGSASVVRNGVTVELNNGDNINQGDVAQTGTGSSLGLVLIDGTTFNLSASARLMLNDLVYDPNGTSNSSLITLVQGAASFVAGQVAKTGDMKVATPVATMGIRGTAVILDISSTDGKVSISVVNQQDNIVHAVQVFDRNGNLIGTVTSNGSSLTLTPTASFQVIAQESNKTPAQVAQEFDAFQQVLSIYDLGKQLVPSTPPPSDGRRGDANPQTPTKFAGSPISPLTSTIHFNTDVGGNTKGSGGTGQGTDTDTNPTNNGVGPIPPSLTTIVSTDGGKQQTTVEVPGTAFPHVVTPSPIIKVSTGTGDHFGPVMSADGHFVTYDPDGAIFLYDRQSNTTITIAAPGDGFTYSSPTISSDGHFVVFQGSDGTHSYVFIYDNNPADPNYQHITQLAAGGSPAISGDGSKIAVENGGGIVLYDQQTHVLASITPTAVAAVIAAAGGVAGSLSKPAISADGHVIAFWNTDPTAPGQSTSPGELLTYNLSTGAITEIAKTTDVANANAASFSADGHYVVFESDAAVAGTPGTHSEVFLYDLNTGTVVFHTDNAGGGSYHPVISPDGHFIIFASDAQLTPDDTNSVADTYVVDVTNPAHPVYTLVSELADGTQGNAASNLGATISAGGLFFAFGSSASNFSTGTTGLGNIFVVDPTSGHSAIIQESADSPSLLTASGIIELTGNTNGITISVSDPGKFSASFDANHNLLWTFTEQKSDFATLAPGQVSTQNFVITLTTDTSSTTIPVKVTVFDADQPPVVVADVAPVATHVNLTDGQENAAYTIHPSDLLAGVTDIDGPSLSIISVSVHSGGGAITHNDDGTWSYTPAQNYFGPVTFDYTASDGTLTSSSTASLTLDHVDQPPVASLVTLADGKENSSYTINASVLLAGVTDVDSTSLSIISVSVHSGGGTITHNDDGTWTYTPAQNYFGPVTFDYTASDGTLTSSSTASLTLDHIDQPPVASPVALADGKEDNSYIIKASNLLAGVTDVDSTSLTIVSVSVASGGGTLVDNKNGTFTYTPARHYSGPVTFDYTASDGTLTSSSTASLTLDHVDQVPTIAVTDGAFTERAGTTGSAAHDVASGTISFTEADPVDRPVVSASFASFSLTDAQHNTITPSAAQLADIHAVETSLTVTPAHGNTNDGSATWTYSVADSHFDFLAAGQTLTLTYTAKVDNGGGNVATAPLRVTITGTNDTPVIAAGTVATGVIGVALPTATSALTPVGAALLLASGPGLISGLGNDTGYGTLALGSGDDNSSGAINIASVFGAAGIDFFGTHYTSLYINNNGNISFGAPESAYTPSTIGAHFSFPIIAPFWADVDTRGQGAVYYDEDAADGVMTITWDDVGYYSGHSNKLDSFQLVLINEGNGNFDIVYRYGQIQWTTGDASGGFNGLGGTPARAGYSAGDGVHYDELAQSGNQSALLALPTTPGNTGVAGVDEFQVRNGVVGPTTVTRSGAINFSDADLTDTHSIKSVTYTGGGTALGTLSLTLVSDTTSSGTGGQFSWIYTADTAAVQSALLYTNDGSKIASFEVLIDDGHGGVLTETVAVTLTASNADVWNGQAHNSSWNTSGNWSLSQAPTADDVVYVDTATPVSLDASHLSDSSIGGLHISSQSAIDLVASSHSGSLEIDGALINQGSILLTDNTTLEASGAIHNSGTITIDATTEFSPSATLLIDGDVVLDGHGTVTLDGTSDSITGTHIGTSTSTLENVDNVINGFGQLGDDHLHLLNDSAGIIDANNASHALIIDTDNTITNNGKLEATNHATLEVDDAVVGTGSATIDSGATLEFGASVAATETVTFEGSTGTLKLDDATHFAPTISGLSGSDGIDLTGFDVNHAHLTRVTTGDTTTLTVTDEHHSVQNGTEAVITLQGSYADSTFHFSNDGHGGVLIVDPPATPSEGTTVTATGINQFLTGTGSNDTFVFNFTAIGQATVTNFNADTDLLQLKAATFANAQAVLDATHDDGGGNAVIALDAHDSITLAGVTKAQLHQTDFHLV